MQNSDSIEKIQQIKDNLEYLNLPERTIDHILSTISSNLQIGINKLPFYLETGFKPIDYLLYPIINNSRIHIYGRESTAKTAIICHILKSMINLYPCKIGWIDSTFRLNLEFFKKLDIADSILLESTTTIDKELVETIITDKYNILVIDDIASFQKTSTSILDELLFACKSNQILVLIANQVRQSPTTGRIYAPKEQLYANYDIVLQSSKYRVNYDQKYKDYDIKLEYHKQNDIMFGKNVIIPISTTGIVNENLMNDRMNRLLSENSYTSFIDLKEQRMKLIESLKA